MSNLSAPTLLKLDDFKAFDAGWCYGDGLKFPDEVILLSKQVIIDLIKNGFNKTDVFPGLSGEIRVTAYVRNHYLEFTVENNREITFLYEVNDNEIEYIEALSLDDCLLKIKEYNWLCDWFAQSIKNTTTKQKADFSLWRSDLHPMEVYQHLNVIAQYAKAKPCASTSRNIIKTWQDRRQSIGNLTPQFSKWSIQSPQQKAHQAILVTAT
ncbi:MAG: ATP-binding protein [Chromatiales bacterium]|nr:ATP-binding protein [Chromatiales bacterium]